MAGKTTGKTKLGKMMRRPFRSSQGEAEAEGGTASAGSSQSQSVDRELNGIARLDINEPPVEIFDSALFKKDFDQWFAKCTVQYYLAMAIQKEHLGYASVNPNDVIENVEAKYRREAVNDQSTTGDIHLGSELFRRIKNARGAGYNPSLEEFLNKLQSDFQRSCHQMRNDKRVELDAESTATIATSTPSFSTQTSYSTSFGTPTTDRSPEVSFNGDWKETPPPQPVNPYSQTPPRQSSQPHLQTPPHYPGNPSPQNSSYQPNYSNSHTPPQKNNPNRPNTRPAPVDLFPFPPPCLKCKNPTTRRENKERDRVYYKCFSPCNIWWAWGDAQGVLDSNPHCYCGKPSRGQISNASGHNGPKQLFFKCAWAGCWYKSDAGNPSNKGPGAGGGVMVDESLVKRMIGLP